MIIFINSKLFRLDFVVKDKPDKNSTVQRNLNNFPVVCDVTDYLEGQLKLI